MTGLSLPDATQLGVGSNEMDQIEKTWMTSYGVQTQLEKIGVVDTPQPQFTCPDVDPATFSSTNAEEVVRTYLQLNSWFSFIAEQLSKVTIYILEYENMLDQVEAQLRDHFRDLKETGRKMTKEELNDKIVANPERIQIACQLQKYRQYKTRLQTRADALDKSIRMISRQVEIRRQELELNHVNQPAHKSQWAPVHNGRFQT